MASVTDEAAASDLNQKNIKQINNSIIVTKSQVSLTDAEVSSEATRVVASINKTNPSQEEFNNVTPGDLLSTKMAQLTIPSSLNQLSLAEYKIEQAFTPVSFGDNVKVIPISEVKLKYPRLTDNNFFIGSLTLQAYASASNNTVSKAIPAYDQFSFDVSQLGTYFDQSLGGDQSGATLTPNALINLLNAATIHSKYLTDLNERIYGDLGILAGGQAVAAKSIDMLRAAEQTGLWNVITFTEYDPGSEIGTLSRAMSGMGRMAKTLTILKNEVDILQSLYMNFLTALIERRERYLVGSNSVIYQQQIELSANLNAENVSRSNQLISLTIEHYSSETVRIIKLLQAEHDAAMAAQAEKYEKIIVDLKRIIAEQDKVIKDSLAMLDKYNSSLDERDLVIRNLLGQTAVSSIDQLDAIEADIQSAQDTDFSRSFDVIANTELQQAQNVSATFAAIRSDVADQEAADLKRTYTYAALAGVAVVGTGGYAYSRLSKKKKEEATMTRKQFDQHEPYRIGN